MSSLLIRDAKIPIKDNYLREANIHIMDDKIVKISAHDTELSVNQYDRVIDAKGLIAVPGGIEIHAHIYDPDYTHHEDFFTGSLAAAYGSITTIYDMPLRMYVEDLKTLEIKVKEGLRNSVINFGIIAGMMNEKNIGNIKQLRDAGVKAFKLFTCKPFRPASDAGITKVIEAVNSNDGTVMIHAEDDAILDYLNEKYKRLGKDDPVAHHESRPAEAESSAVARVLMIAKMLNMRVHFAHISAGLSARLIRKAKEAGVQVTAETCPHYLLFTKDDVMKWGNYLKMNPALKTKDDVRELWRALADGTIDVVTSDHAPSPRDEKEVDVWSAWGGIPGVETMFPAIFTYGVKRLRLLTIERYVEVTSANPAKIMGIYPRKGTLTADSDADVALIDPSLTIRVTPDVLHHKVDWTPYEGMELCGWPKHLIVNGKVVIEDRDFIRENVSPRYVES